MKLVSSAFLLLFTLACFSQTTVSDTTIHGVLVSFRFSPSIFPVDWQAAPISAKASAINTTEIGRSKSVMINALKKYPTSALVKNLRAVYFIKEMTFYNVGYGGTNSTDALYLTNAGTKEGYTNLYLEQTFHHEYSSILYRNFP